MEATSIAQLLKGFCDSKRWKYAVFWKLNHHFPMTLTWENGFYGYLKTKEAVESMFGDISFKSPDDVYSSGSESIDDSGQYSAQQVMTEMSHLKYSLGEGVVGKIALTRDHCWVFCDDIISSRVQTNLIPECPYEWLLQFASGIKTIVLVPVIPQGVLQFGSFETVAEDLDFVTNIKEKFHSIHCLAANTTLLNLGRNVQAWSFSDLTDTLMDSLDESSSITNNILKRDVSGSISLNINGSTKLNPAVPSFIQDDLCMSGENQIDSLKRASENEISSSSIEMSIDPRHIDQVKMKSNHMEEDNWDCSQWISNVGVVGETSNGSGSYPDKHMTEQQSGCIDISPHDVKNANDFFTFPLESELHKALGPVAHRQTAKFISKYISVEDTYSSSTLISNKKEPDHIKDLDFPTEDDAEYLLDAVIGNLCSASDDTSSISNSIRSPIITPIEFVGSFQPNIHSEEGILIVENSDMRSDLMPAVMVKGRDDFTNQFTSPSCDENSSFLIDEAQQEKVYSHMKPINNTGKKRARVGTTERSRPRDRQMIMDRMKELRELVPDGGRCSIDNLLDRTIKHMLYLRKITSQAEKLKRFEHREVPESNKRKVNGSHPGRSCAFDFESELAWPIVIEDLECPGHMLIEIICSEHGLFLEIAQVIRKLELTILKGVLENCSSIPWARFIVEVPRGFHRMDVLCPLLHLLQHRRNPVSNKS